MHSNNFNRWSVSRCILVSLLAVVSMPALSFGNVTEQADSLPVMALLSYIDKAGKLKTVRSFDEWQTRRRQIQDSMQAVMGNLPDRKHLPPFNTQTLDSITTKNYTRYNIRFTAAEKEEVPAYLYVPVKKTRGKKFPGILALHETGMQGKKIADGQTGKPNLAYAKELAERGYIVIAPDYPGFGDLKEYDFKTDRYQSGTMKSIFDNMRCIDLLLSRADVDASSIGVIGHSLGGHNAIFTGAFDDRLKVVVSSCGWTLMHSYFNGDSASAGRYGGKLWPWSQERYMPLMRDKYNLDPDKIPFDFDEAIAAIAPRAFFSNSPVNDGNFNAAGIQKGIANIREVYDFLQVPGNLQVRYPDSEHDFPLRVRWQAYDFIDSVFGLAPGKKAGFSYSDNPHYFKRMELFAKQKSEKNIVMLGNSLTEGGFWDTILQRNDVANRGIGSDITEGYINRINDIFDLKPAICFIEGGVNDLSRGISQEVVTSNLSKLIDTLRSENIIPVLHTVTYVADNYKWHDPKTFNSSIQKLNIAIRALAKKKKAILIDLNEKITDGRYLLKQYAISDGIHYTAATYSLWAKEILKILQQVQKLPNGSSGAKNETGKDLNR
ncbi:MAG: alpha/beta fold hydrolase [Agriterribacter sp.]